MASYDLDTLSSVPISRDFYSVTESDPTDVFAFEIVNNRQISLYLHGISANDDADLRLYADSNGNGVLDKGDTLVASSINGGNADDVIDYSASAGMYFAEVSRYSFGSVGSVSYNLDLAATYDVGTLGTTPISRNNYFVSELDPTDVFEFDLSSSQTISLALTDITDNDDADLRLYEDTNNNGIFDSDDQELANSRNGGNADDVITYSAVAGTYFAQVERYGPGSDGTVTYDLDLSVIDGFNPPNVPSTYLPFDTSQVFALNSNPDADHTIYLDFDGHITSNTAWNIGNSNSLLTPAYDTDGNVSSFSTAELEEIWSIWQRVAEDFMPFDVNVTTALPSNDQLVNSGGNDTEWGLRVAVGGSSSDWYTGSAGGVAYLDSFNWNSDTPVFAFSEEFGSTDNVAEVITHEIGHALGLEHDGTSSVEYYAGHGSGETGWAPIMGVGYYQELTQWSQGEYADADNLEDDLSIITSNNGFGYRADDYGDDLINPSALTFGAAGVETYGIIETNTDVDVFEFTSFTGNIALDIDPFFNGANLDILAELYDASGQLILGSNPINELSASFNLSLNPGDYYLSVTGTGQGSPATGYSDYGSLGQYSITGAIA